MTAGIVVLLAAQIVASNSAAPTFSRDVAPLLRQHCSECHRPGGAAPFSLLTYDDVRPRAREIVAAASAGQMPPWKAVGPVGQFVGDRRLAGSDVAMLQTWVRNGAPRGDGDLPPSTRSSSAWELGPPDMVVTLESPYRLPAGGSDRLRNFVIRLPVDRTRYVRAWEFRPSNPRVVHHATMMLDRGGAARRADAEDRDSGYEGLIPFSAQSPDGFFLGWTPGQRASISGTDLAWRIDPGDDLIVMLHMRPDETTEDVDAAVALYFADRPPSRTPVMIRLNQQNLDIPAGDPSYVVTDHYVLPAEVDLLAVQPHAHYLARSVEVSARLPGGSVSSLLQIPDWDFHWQDAYRYRQPVRLPAGTELTMRIAFDNSAGNRANPTYPPTRVIWGQRAIDEMADVWLQVVPVRADDRTRLAADVRRKLIPQHVDGYRKMLEVDPRNVALHDDLALLGIESGDMDLAIAEFAESVRLKPAAAASHYNLGNALVAAHRAGDAIEHLREAVRLEGGYGLAHQGLGVALAATGNTNDAIVHLEEAVRLLPQSADARYDLGLVLQQQGNFAGALDAYDRAARIDGHHADARYAAGLIREANGEFAAAVKLFRNALVVRPAWTQARVELAWVLATTPDAAVRQPAEALRLATSAAEATGFRDPRSLDVLAAALAAVGRYEEAASRARLALGMLPPATADGHRVGIEHRLALYERRQAFVLDLTRR
jgi:tetratricopeptide (TPR) repeat protein